MNIQSIIFQWFARNNSITEKYIENINNRATIEKSNVYLVLYGYVNNINKLNNNVKIIEYDNFKYDINFKLLGKDFTIKSLLNNYYSKQTNLISKLNFGFIIDLMRLGILLNRRIFDGEYIIYMDTDIYTKNDESIHIDYEKVNKYGILFNEPNYKESKPDFENSLIIFRKDNNIIINGIMYILSFFLDIYDTTPVDINIYDGDFIHGIMLKYIRYVIKFDSYFINSKKIPDIYEFEDDDKLITKIINDCFIYKGNVYSTYDHSWHCIR